MIQSILDHPWAFLGMLLALLLLQVAAAMRIRRDRRRKQRALVDRRQGIRPGPDRRWLARPRSK